MSDDEHLRWIHKDSPLTFSPMRTMECRCYQCGFWTTYPMRTAEDAETRQWRERYYALLGKMNQALADVRQRFGEDPMAVMFQERLIKLREEMRLPREGDERKRPQP